MKRNLNIRDARSSDAGALAGLSGELGYPTTPSEMKGRLEVLLSKSNHGIFIAERETLLGWIHVSIVDTLESESFAEIRGLVVSESYRGSGIGTQLVATAENWADKNGCKRIRVRTNVIREEARAFYKKLGYISNKTQEIYDKILNFGA
ncbi:MAG: GNAT family N-acetyltransferase [Bacteroidota bacterium]